MKAYYQFKSGYPDSVLFFSIGEDHAAFCEDAKVISSALDLPLGHRAVSGDDIPVVSLDEIMFKVYLNKLIRAGHKVTTVEQLGGRDVIKTYLPAKSKVG